MENGQFSPKQLADMFKKHEPTLSERLPEADLNNGMRDMAAALAAQHSAQRVR